MSNEQNTLSPAHIEDGEEVEVVGYSIEGRDEIGVVRIRRLADRPFPEHMQDPRDWAGPFNVVSEPLMAVAQHERIVAARSCPCQTDTARETRRKDGIEAAELQGILTRDHEACRPRDAGLMGWAAAALSAPPAAGTTSEQYRAELYDEVWQKARDMGYGNVTDALVELERIKAAPPASVVPEGWKLVPIKPTDDMVVAFAEQWYSKKQVYDDPDMDDAYASMLSAAPTPPASEQQQTVPRHKFEGLVEEVRLKDAEIARLAEQVMNLQAYRDGESGDGVWYWQGDGEDHLESLTCPIVIRPQDLRRLVASEQQRAVVMPEKQVEYVGDRDHKQWASGANWMLREFLRLNPHLATPPASEQQRAVVMPERKAPFEGADGPPDWRPLKNAEVSGWNACVAEFLRLNPNLQPAAPSQGGEQ